jgi:hypothetical protein
MEKDIIKKIFKTLTNTLNKFNPDTRHIESTMNFDLPTDENLLLILIISIIIIAILSYFIGLKDAVIIYICVCLFIIILTIVSFSVTCFLGYSLGVPLLLIWFYLIHNFLETLDNSKKPGDNDKNDDDGVKNG